MPSCAQIRRQRPRPGPAEEAKRISRRLAQAPLAIAWNMSRPGVTSPIVSATSLAQLHQIVQAARLKLDAATLEGLDRASA